MCGYIFNSTYKLNGAKDRTYCDIVHTTRQLMQHSRIRYSTPLMPANSGFDHRASSSMGGLTWAVMLVLALPTIGAHAASEHQNLRHLQTVT